MIGLHMNKSSWATGVALITGAAFAVIVFAANEHSLGANNSAPPDEIKAALERTAQALRENSACPTDAGEFDKIVGANWRHLHPKLDDRERQRDPEYVAAHQAASHIALSAREIAAELMKDPSFIQKRNAAAAAMGERLVSRREAEQAAIRQAEAVRARENAERLKTALPE
jgi:hypothetical protein